MSSRYKMPSYNSKEGYFERREREEKENMDKAYKEYAKKFPFLQRKFLNDFTFEDAVWHYRLGKGASIDVNLSSLDLSRVRVNDFNIKGDKWKDINGTNAVRLVVNFNQTYYTNPRQALIYGSITLIYIGNNKVMALPDTYDFDIKLNPTKRGLIRDFATLGGSFYNGHGKPYEIRFLGTTTIRN